MALANMTRLPRTEWIPAKEETVKDSDEMIKKFRVFDGEIARQAVSLQADDYTVKGYSPEDLDLIQQALVDLVASYDKADVVVRNSSGRYVARSELK